MIHRKQLTFLIGAAAGVGGGVGVLLPLSVLKFSNLTEMLERWGSISRVTYATLDLLQFSFDLHVSAL